MSVVRPLSPGGLRRALEAAGYQVIDEDEDGDNWLMANNESTIPIVVPKRGRLVSVPVMESLYHLAPGEIHAELQREAPQDADDEELEPPA